MNYEHVTHGGGFARGVPMKISDEGLQFIMDREGIRLDAYPDPGTGGEPITIGVGHTDPGNIKIGDTCTREQAMAWLRSDARHAEGAVNSQVTVPLGQHQFDALVDFVFNEGVGNFSSSTLLRLLNAGDFEGADHQFNWWNLAGGRVLAGLTARREGEAEMFEEVK